MEDNLNTGEPLNPRPPLTSAQKKILMAAGVIILMGASFFAGRYSAQMKSQPPNPFTQLPPTPVPLGTPVPVVESALTMIDFTGVSEAKKAEVLSTFNNTSCQCNCKMTVAACMIKDPNCPFWNDHVTQFQKALGNGKKPKVSKVSKPNVMMPPGGSNGFTLPSGSPNGFTVPQGKP